MGFKEEIVVFGSALEYLVLIHTLSHDVAQDQAFTYLRWFSALIKEPRSLEHLRFHEGMCIGQKVLFSRVELYFGPIAKLDRVLCESVTGLIWFGTVLIVSFIFLKDCSNIKRIICLVDTPSVNAFILEVWVAFCFPFFNRWVIYYKREVLWLFQRRPIMTHSCCHLACFRLHIIFGVLWCVNCVCHLWLIKSRQIFYNPWSIMIINISVRDSILESLKLQRFHFKAKRSSKKRLRAEVHFFPR